MKKVLLLAGAIVMCASMAFATVTPGFGGVFVMYSDAAYTSCNMIDTAPALQNVYVRHELIPCAAAGQFKIDNHGYTASWISDNYGPNLAIGDSQNGLALSYGANQALPYLMVTINYFGSGTSLPCSYLGMVPDPTETDGIIAAVDCSQHKLVATPSTLTINGDPTTCPCGYTPVQDSNWSKIKSLYK